MMALSFGLLTNQVRHDIAPAALLAELNGEIHLHTQRTHLNTALCYLALKRLDAHLVGAHRAGWELRAANAGLIAPLLRRPDGNVDWLDVRGLPLGMHEEVEYHESVQALVPGSTLVMSSDGIVEAMNVMGEMYGFERLVKCVAAAPQSGAQTLVEWMQFILALKNFSMQVSPAPDSIYTIRGFSIRHAFLIWTQMNTDFTDFY
jgi:serine phosphatase RsbU (regulator of sigma subunit)